MTGEEKKEYHIGILKNGINRILADTAQPYVSRLSVRVYAKSDWDAAREALQRWQSEGILEIIKDPESAEDDEYCVKMLRFIDKDSPSQNF